MNYPPYYTPYQFGYQPRQDVPPAPMPQAAQGFPCRPVTSREEAVAAQIPFDGSTSYFVDTANGKIYAKTFNLADGTAPLVAYVREQAAPAVQYATIADINALREEIERLKKPSKKAVKNDDADE